MTITESRLKYPVRFWDEAFPAGTVIEVATDMT